MFSREISSFRSDVFNEPVSCAYVVEVKITYIILSLEILREPP